MFVPSSKLNDWIYFDEIWHGGSYNLELSLILLKDRRNLEVPETINVLLSAAMYPGGLCPMYVLLGMSMT